MKSKKIRIRTYEFMDSLINYPDWRRKMKSKKIRIRTMIYWV